MKLILSRKGFDSQYGGIPSPIIDNHLISLPIPNDSNDCCCNVANSIPLDGIFYDNMSLRQIWDDLSPNAVKSEYCHYDPVLKHNLVANGVAPSACDIADVQGDQPSNNGDREINEGDLFVFFDTFRAAERKADGGIQYKEGSKAAYMLFGFLQIGKIVEGEDIAKYASYPHSSADRFGYNNRMYIASKELVFNGRKITTSSGKVIPGAGTFDFSEDLLLKKCDGVADLYIPKSTWDVEDYFKNIKVSYHSYKSSKSDSAQKAFQTVAKGQEFVLYEDSSRANGAETFQKVIEWARRTIQKHFDETSNPVLDP